jgi:hypothetical protein
MMLRHATSGAVRNVEPGVVCGSGSESCPSRNPDKPITKLLQGSCLYSRGTWARARMAEYDG